MKQLVITKEDIVRQLAVIFDMPNESHPMWVCGLKLNLPKVVGFDWIYISTEAPSRTPDFIGQFYIDTTNKVAYLAVGVDNSSDYKRITN